MFWELYLSLAQWNTALSFSWKKIGDESHPPGVLASFYFFSEENEMKIFIIADSLLKVENIAHLEDPPLNLCRQIFIEQRI